MVVKYKNDAESLVDLNIFVGSISFKRWILNNILPIVYTIITLGLGGWLINRYGGLEETNRMLIYVLVVCNIFIWIRVTVFKKRVIRKSVQKMIEKNPAYIQKKSVTRREKDFVVQNLEDKKKTLTFKLESISRAIEKNGYIYMLKKDNTPMLMIPKDSFHNESDIKEFLRGIELEED